MFLQVLKPKRTKAENVPVLDEMNNRIHTFDFFMAWLISKAIATQK